MTNPVRQEVLQVLGELSELCPEMRFGQLIANLSVMARGAAVESIWDMEDEELLAAAKRQREIFHARRPSVA